MDAKTLAALRQSIKKWERNAVAETPKGFTTTSANCPLCKLFSGRGGCNGCPVEERTGQWGCRGTPYSAADGAHDEWSDCPSSPALRDAAHAAARAEVEFLRSLLPEDETTP